MLRAVAGVTTTVSSSSVIVTMAVRDDGVSGVNELLQGKEGTTISDLSVRFEVKKPTAGKYTLIIVGLWGPFSSEVTGETTFTVPAAPTLGE